MMTFTSHELFAASPCAAANGSVTLLFQCGRACLAVASTLGDLR